MMCNFTEKIIIINLLIFFLKFQSLLAYHKQCAEILQGVTETLYEKTNEASAKPRADFKPKTLEDLGVERSSDYNLSDKGRLHRPGSSNR